jgi:hypothetical protein
LISTAGGPAAGDDFELQDFTMQDFLQEMQDLLQDM